MLKRGDELDYNGSPAGYADQPDEVINYVDAHDNETLYDLSVFKLPTDTPMADRVRMNTLSLATVTLSQSPSFWHAGTELLRSKSLDRNSYNSGDWFNRIDWTGQESTFGSGLPNEADNGAKWSIMEPLLANPALKPGAADIAAAEASALDLLRVRDEVDLLQLGSAELIDEKVTFPNSGPDATPGLIVMQIDDLVGEDVDPELDGALVVFNSSPEAITEQVDGLAGRGFALTDAQANGADAVVKTTAWDAATGTVTVPARSVAVLVDEQAPPAVATRRDRGAEQGVREGRFRREGRRHGGHRRRHRPGRHGHDPRRRRGHRHDPGRGRQPRSLRREAAQARCGRARAHRRVRRGGGLRRLAVGALRDRALVAEAGRGASRRNRPRRPSLSRSCRSRLT